ncbi:MAG: ABC transporter ATP-binding protein [Chloroflexota bacterium]
MFRTPRRTRQQLDDDPDAVAPRLNKESLHLFRRTLAYVRPHRWRMILALISLAFAVALSLVFPLIVRSLVDTVLIEKNLQFLNQIVIGLLLIFIVQACFSFVHRISLAYVGERIVADMRVQVYTHLQRLSLQYFTDHRTGEIVSRLTNDISLIQGAVTNNLVDLLRQLLALAGGVIFLFYLDWRLTLVILVGIPIFTLTIVVLGRQIRTAAKAVQDHLAESANVIEETVSGVRIVKSFARETYEVSRFKRHVEDIFAAGMQRAKITAYLSPAIGFLAYLSITLTLWFGSYEVIQGRLSAGGLVAYLVYTLMVASPIAGLAGLYSQFQSALGAIERIFDLLDTMPDIDDHPNAIELPEIQGGVQFRQVDFHYNVNASVLKDVSFVAQPGQVIALVGPSGAGKTTVINLVPRFYDASAGEILVDNNDIKAVTIQSLRRQIGIVPQDPMLFSDTVAENIRYGKLDATDEEIENAARAANAHDFIQQDLPDGYQTLVGERGVKLSGGQRQRVAIARAILKDPRILILDEATSSLDSESEQLVQQALDRLMKGRTTFVIAHRLSTIINADQIIVLSAGQIVEQGTHQQLLVNEDGLYYRLHQMQFSSDRRLAPDPISTPVQKEEVM